ncbi:Pentatricopeptide repeat-containing protein, chloroplastic [Sesamum angolense]|uniref:Pentatricopeptide repeat-containing protein, chloroplastic n=1 Tax=Sesamum angolense TaxID=2727404 RepID=A0AAE1WUD4_9LAMI|nr:Pentatricopeptide repeat-containing protein, chloroplastic [Sesamum angolense]
MKMLDGLCMSETAIGALSFINYTHNPLFLRGFPIMGKPVVAIAPRRRKRGGVITRSALSDGGGVLLDQEFEFKPSFDEYLKALETVKIDRDNNSDLSNNNARKRKSIKKIVREEENGNDEVTAVQENSRMGVLHKKSAFVQEDSRKDGFRREIASEVVKKKQDKNTESLTRKKSDRRESRFLDLERAAFKSLEYEDDVVDKPRISRVDMEERIQKLAKWGESLKHFSAASSGRGTLALSILAFMSALIHLLNYLMDSYIYTAALDALGKARRPVEALNLFRTMQEQMASYPDIVAYHCIAVTLGQAGHMKELFDVIDSMRSPPKKKFKTDFLEKWDPRLEPDVIVYNAVMLACGKYNLVHDFFKKVQKSYIPSALIYKVLVNALWREGKIDEAIMAVEEMEKRGIIGNAGLYYDLARCLCSAGRCHEALNKLIDKICKVANKPLVVTYTGLIQACVDAGDVGNGAYIFKHMQKFCSPNLVTCNIMLKAFLDHGMFEEAKQLFLRLLENGNFIRHEEDYKVRVIPDIYSFNTMLDACALEQKWDDLEFVYAQMLKYGHHFNAKRHLRLILDARRAGKVELLETTWKHLVETERIPPPLLVMEMFCTRLEQGDYTAAVSYLTNFASIESQVFSRKSWLKIFIENGHRFEEGTLDELVHEASILVAKSENLPLQHLIGSCREYLSSRRTSTDPKQAEIACKIQEVGAVF